MEKDTNYYEKLFKDAEQEIPEYLQEVNQIFGLTLITIVGIIISSKNPIYLWWCFLPLVIGLMIRMWNRYPPALRKLRKEKKLTDNLYEKLGNNNYLTKKLKAFDRRHFGIKTFFTDHILYTFGYFSYIMLGITMLFYPNIVSKILNI